MTRDAIVRHLEAQNRSDGADRAFQHAQKGPEFEFHQPLNNCRDDVDGCPENRSDLSASFFDSVGSTSKTERSKNASK